MHDAVCFNSLAFAGIVTAICYSCGWMTRLTWCGFVWSWLHTEMVYLHVATVTIPVLTWSTSLITDVELLAKPEHERQLEDSRSRSVDIIQNSHAHFSVNASAVLSYPGESFKSSFKSIFTLLLCMLLVCRRRTVFSNDTVWDSSLQSSSMR